MEQSYEILAVDDDAAIVNILETTANCQAKCNTDLRINSTGER